MTASTERFEGPSRTRSSLSALSWMQAFFSRFAVQVRVVRALMIRDIMAQYGRQNLGFLWLIGEPMALIVGVIILWSLMKGSTTHGVSVVAFTLTGYSMLTLWRHLLTRGGNGLSRHATLLFHQNIRLLDILIAQILMEMISIFLSFLVCYLLLFLFGYVEPANDNLLLVSGWLLMSLFGAGMTLLLSGLTEMSKPLKRLLQPILYFTLPLTGAFAMCAWLPERARDVILVFPMVHAMELFRAGFMGERFTFYYNIWYLFAWGIGTFFLGLLVMKRAERHLHIG
ncbi:ABC transporter permease [Jiella marina]|uniref:ABC transporter permease n=1 Tax=Jiella sp. LLJ827 TaxID=2917712 RepID=UPI002100A18A|nr:ABC transporter permease [Jiella sp. LLJ827]MCQ0990289.1 ABC transporter permease [Jiella sp. LLJ827]